MSLRPIVDADRVSLAQQRTVETFIRREDAERFTEDVRRDDSGLAEPLRIENESLCRPSN